MLNIREVIVHVQSIQWIVLSSLLIHIELLSFWTSLHDLELFVPVNQPRENAFTRAFFFDSFVDACELVKCEWLRFRVKFYLSIVFLLLVLRLGVSLSEVIRCLLVLGIVVLVAYLLSVVQLDQILLK